MAEHWVGTDQVTAKRSDANFWEMLNRLHLGTGGAGIAWCYSPIPLPAVLSCWR